jgi:hypothetical protein
MVKGIWALGLAGVGYWLTGVILPSMRASTGV